MSGCRGKRLWLEEDVKFDIDQWHNLVEPQTFKTTLIDIPPDVSKAYIAEYRHRYCNAQTPSANETQLLSEMVVKYGAWFRLLCSIVITKS
jgi:hypothetical protein